MFFGKDTKVNTFLTCLTKEKHKTKQRKHKNIRSEKMVKSQNVRDNKKVELTVVHSYILH